MKTLFALIALWLLLAGTSSAQLITSQSAGTPSATGATITWTTCAAANSQVNYGTDATYGSQTTLDATSVTSHSVAITGLSSAVIYHFQVVSTDAGGATVTGADGTFTTAGVSVAVTTNPSNTTACAGTTVTLSAAATGTPAPSVQWKQSTDGGSTYANIAGATSPIYSFTAMAGQNGYKYEAVFTNAGGSATSSAATLTVNTSPVVTTQPISTSVTAGGTATFVAAGSGTPSPTVQWQQSIDGGTTWANISGAVSGTLTLAGTTVGQNGYKYRAAFTNSCSVVYSSTVTLTVASSQTYNLSFSASSARTSGAFLQGASLSGTKYLFTSLANSATTFNISGVAKVCFWLDDVAMLGTPLCRFSSPFDFSVGGTVPVFKQVNAATPQTPTSPVTVNYTAAQTAGDLNVVIVGRNNSTSNVTAVTDSKGNTYTLINALGISGVRQGIYYAKNIVAATAGSNTVTVTFDVAPPFPDVRILEYSGIDTVAPLDTNQGASGNSSIADSGAAVTTFANDLLVGAATTAGAFTASGAGFTTRILTTPDADIAFDKNVNAVGSYNATATQSATALWAIQLAAFKAASSVSGWDTTKVSNATHTLTQQVTTTSGATETDTATFMVSNTVTHSVDLAWVKGTATNAVTYNVYRATGACGGTFGAASTRLASGLAAAAYTDTTVASGTTYCYAVTQIDSVTALPSPLSSLVPAVIP